MSRILLAPILLALIALGLVACDDSGVGSDDPTATGAPGTFVPSPDVQTALQATAETTPGPVSSPTSGAAREPGVAAAEDLALRLGQPVEDIVIVSTTPMEWPDSCLGVGDPNEVCAQVIVSGFEVILELGDTTYAYRTNEDGTVARFAGVFIDGG